MITDKKNIYIWCPFTSKIGTINNVINSCFGLIKFSKSNVFNISLINVFGEWDDYLNDIKLDKIKTENLNSIRFIKAWKKEGFLKSRISYLLIFVSSFFSLFFILKKKKPDFIIIHLITSLPIILFSLFNFKTKLILHIAGHPKMTFFRKLIWKTASSKITKIICPSEELKDFLSANKIFNESKMIVIQDPHLSIKRINNLKNEEVTDEFFDDKKILISIGRLTKQKNYPFLINNFNKLISKYNDIKLLIIGSGEMKIKLEKLINKSGLQNKVKLINHNQNIYKYLKKSNYYVSTSVWEGSSLAMIDAAYMGIPILCSNCPTGRKEFIDKNERGFLYNEGNDLDFLNKFIEMHEMDLEFIKIKMINAKNASKNFTIFKNYSKLASILK
jgi:glycosyltransferase involved in cell wall biosynthesis